MSGWKSSFWHAALYYLIASVGCMLYLQWPHYAGHAHVPFSSFPSFLVFAPFSPYFAVTRFRSSSAESIGALAVFFAVFVATRFIIGRTVRKNIEGPDRHS